MPERKPDSAHGDGEMKPAEGCLFGVLIGVVLWAVVILLGIGPRALVIIWNAAGQLLTAL